MGNVRENARGIARGSITVHGRSVSQCSPISIIDRAIVLHASMDAAEGEKVHRDVF